MGLVCYLSIWTPVDHQRVSILNSCPYGHVLNTSEKRQKCDRVYIKTRNHARRSTVNACLRVQDPYLKIS